MEITFNQPCLMASTGIEDCYYFLYSTCDRKNCAFRHSTEAKKTLILCERWRDQQDCVPQCPFRHSAYHLNKKRLETGCFYEQKGACTKEYCEYKHQDPQRDAWKFAAAASNNASKEAVEDTNQQPYSHNLRFSMLNDQNMPSNAQNTNGNFSAQGTPQFSGFSLSAQNLKTNALFESVPSTNSNATANAFSTNTSNNVFSASRDSPWKAISTNERPTPNPSFAQANEQIESQFAFKPPINQFNPFTQTSSTHNPFGISQSPVFSFSNQTEDKKIFGETNLFNNALKNINLDFSNNGEQNLQRTPCNFNCSNSSPNEPQNPFQLSQTSHLLKKEVDRQSSDLPLHDYSQGNGGGSKTQSNFFSFKDPQTAFNCESNINSQDQNVNALNKNHTPFFSSNCPSNFRLKEQPAHLNFPTRSAEKTLDSTQLFHTDLSVHPSTAINHQNYDQYQVGSTNFTHFDSAHTFPTFTKYQNKAQSVSNSGIQTLVPNFAGTNNAEASIQPNLDFKNDFDVDSLFASSLSNFSTINNFSVTKHALDDNKSTSTHATLPLDNNFSWKPTNICEPKNIFGANSEIPALELNNNQDRFSFSTQECFNDSNKQAKFTSLDTQNNPFADFLSKNTINSQFSEKSSHSTEIEQPNLSSKHKMTPWYAHNCFNSDTQSETVQTIDFKRASKTEAFKLRDDITTDTGSLQPQSEKNSGQELPTTDVLPLFLENRTTDCNISGNMSQSFNNASETQNNASKKDSALILPLNVSNSQFRNINTSNSPSLTCELKKKETTDNNLVPLDPFAESQPLKRRLKARRKQGDTCTLQNRKTDAIPFLNQEKLNLPVSSSNITLLDLFSANKPTDQDSKLLDSVSMASNTDNQKKTNDDEENKDFFETQKSILRDTLNSLGASMHAIKRRNSFDMQQSFKKAVTAFREPKLLDENDRIAKTAPLFTSYAANPFSDENILKERVEKVYQTKQRSLETTRSTVTQDYDDPNLNIGSQQAPLTNHDSIGHLSSAPIDEKTVSCLKMDSHSENVNGCKRKDVDPSCDIDSALGPEGESCSKQGSLYSENCRTISDEETCLKDDLLQSSKHPIEFENNCNNLDHKSKRKSKVCELDTQYIVETKRYDVSVEDGISQKNNKQQVFGIDYKTNNIFSLQNAKIDTIETTNDKNQNHESKLENVKHENDLQTSSHFIQTHEKHSFLRFIHVNLLDLPSLKNTQELGTVFSDNIKRKITEDRFVSLSELLLDMVDLQFEDKKISSEAACSARKKRKLDKVRFVNNNFIDKLFK